LTQLPFYVGGHTAPALRRAVRIGQGWTAAMMGFVEIVTTIGRLGELLDADGRSLGDRGDGHPFAIQVACIDKYSTSGFGELAAAGATDVIVITWLIEDHGYDAPLEVKRESLARFGEKYITP